ncbi:hypothetical protein SAMN05444266_111163 [Chitinophaga jiangningensis]|uniref:Uncharacterized protein n=1 Tax=Chitinophaga jiangningensis TaxID=1419482 RepID=A0A1M7LVH2_9BACT|nr:DUF5691 domain-containing protein [Chitinophaga jiangningensis]SHM82130.1 hypothetical protein SAMN05444266_111163 [Chitinophaga jiangningensis]
MELWQQIINTALLGTDKQALPPIPADDELGAALAVIRHDTGNDREDVLLKTGAVLFNYRQAGTTAMPADELLPNTAAPETRAYCSPEAVASLQEAMDLGSNALTKHWLELCADAGYLLPPAMLPLLMDKATGSKQLRAPLMKCCGNRGLWLAQLNPDWHLLLPGHEIEINADTWETGTLPQRCEALTQRRAEDPEAALTMLMETWKQENAATRAALLECLQTELNPNDIPWLQQLTADKSLKVKEKAWELLRKLPQSEIVQSYQQLVAAAINSIDGNIFISELQLPLPANIYQSGIDKLPPSALHMSDETYQLQQLVAQVPCSFLSTHLALPPATCVTQLASAGMEAALLKAAIHFNETAWISHILEQTNTFYPEVFHLAPPAVLEAYAMRFAEKEGSAVILRMGTGTTTWGLAITQQIFKFIAMHPYSYNRNYFLELAHLLPVDILHTDEKNYFGDILYNQQAWKSLKEKLFELIACKAAIQQHLSLP